MGKVRIELDTLTDIREFVDIVSDPEIKGSVKLTDGNEYVINAKSLLAAMCTVEWGDLYCVSDEDIYIKISKFAR